MLLTHTSPLSAFQLIFTKAQVHKDGRTSSSIHSAPSCPYKLNCGTSVSGEGSIKQSHGNYTAAQNIITLPT